MPLKFLLCCLLLQFIFPRSLFSQTFDAEILRYSSFIELDKDKLIQTDSVIIQINTRAGDKYTEITIPYSKSNKVSNIEAWIEDTNGRKVRELKKSEIKDKSAISDISLYEDNFDKYFELKNNLYPYKVFYTYKTAYRNFITIASWSPVIYSSIPTKTAILKASLPIGFRYNTFIGSIHDFRSDSTEKNILLEWEASYDKPVKPEIFSQPERLKPYVIIAPLNFTYDVEGSTKDWESYGNWQYRLIEGLDILPEDEKNRISTLIKGIIDKKEIVKILYHYMQDHTRYINVSIGIGGLKPYPASYVSQNKYGDCKALTNYMKALLSYVGIESFYTKVNADEQPPVFINDFAGPQFNHIVLAVPLYNDTIWLENTVNTNPFGYMGTFTQNREALLISKDHSHLVRIPALKLEDDHVSYKLDFDIKIAGNTAVKLNISFKGDDFESFNQLHSEFTDNEKDRIIRNYMPFDNYEVLNWDLKKMNRDTARIVLNAALNLNKFLKPLGKEFYFNSFPSRIPAFTIPSNRTLPVELPYPLCNSDTIIYNMPTGYEMKNKPDTLSIKTRFGSYTLKLNGTKEKIQVIKRFELFSGFYSLKQYPEFHAFIKSVKDADQMKIILKPQN